MNVQSQPDMRPPLHFPNIHNGLIYTKLTTYLTFSHQNSKKVSTDNVLLSHRSIFYPFIFYEMFVYNKCQVLQRYGSE